MADNFSVFFMKTKRTFYKWWCVVYRPVYKLFNNGYWPPEKEPGYINPQPPVYNNTNTVTAITEQPVTANATAITSSHAVEATNTVDSSNTIDTTVTVDSSDIQATIEKLRREEEERRKAEIEAARIKGLQQQRINEVLQSNNRTISHYIDEAKQTAPTSAASDDTATNKIDDDAIRRANEILARLNREASEDSAKKEAEIEAAKQAASKIFDK